MSRCMLKNDEQLLKGDHLSSTNGKYKAIFQHDRKFVIYEVNPIWSSDTWGNHDRIVMQNDGNLVMYGAQHGRYWRARTSVEGGSGECCARLRDDGKLVIEDNGEEVWNSASSKGQKEMICTPQFCVPK